MLLGQSVLLGLSIIAYVAQSMSAALTAGRRSMDWMGVCLIGSITALGGGSVRDVLLGHYPLVWVKEPWLLLLTCGGAAAAIALAQMIHRFRIPFLILDAIGLVVFTIAGCEVALEMNQPLAIVILSGMITGCIGGVLRDVLCNEVPLLLRSELYASVSVVTGLVYLIGLRSGLNPDLVVFVTFIVGMTFRLLAIRFRWEMPKFVYTRDEH
jgi:uncharacterized membrane protein YeiH